jgi:hypothetical protein
MDLNGIIYTSLSLSTVTKKYTKYYHMPYNVTLDFCALVFTLTLSVPALMMAEDVR